MAEPIGPNLINNGSFETGTGVSPTAWTGATNGGRVDKAAGQAASGTGYYAFSADAKAHGGTLQQSIATEAGKTYTVSYKAGVSWQGATGVVDARIQLDVLNGGTLIESQNTTLPMTKAAGYLTHTYTFTATSAQTTLKFTDTSPNGQADFDVGLDLVAVHEAPPVKQTGEWGDLMDWPVIGLHAVITQDGKLLTFGTDNKLGTANFQSAMIHDVWDPVTGQHHLLDHSSTAMSDVFCSAAIILPGTSQILIGGGDMPQAGNQTNNKDSTVYDNDTHQMTPSPEGDMTTPRWYPTMVSLPTGQVIVMGGTGGGNTEIFTPGEGWRELTGAPTSIFSDGTSYPRAWVGNNGEVYVFATGGGGNNIVELKALDVSGEGSVRNVGNLPFMTDGISPAIMYDAGKVLVMATNGELWKMDISGATPTYAKVGLATADRNYSNMTVLANGDVLINGGTRTGNNEAPAITDAMIFDPDSGTLTAAGTEAHARVYHGTSILLPDGSVISLGSGSAGMAETNYLDGQIYKPPYLFDANGKPAVRPDIVAAPDKIVPGETFTITVDNSAAIKELTFIKSGATTHTLNMDASAVDLTFKVVNATTIEVSVPADVNAVTAGSWMLFAWNDKGVPSIAEMVAVQPTVPAYDGIGDVTAEYFAISTTALTLDQINLDAPAIHTERVSTIQESGTGAYYPGGPADDFGVRFKGDFNVDKAGTYTFYLTANDGARLKIDGMLVAQTVGTTSPQNLTQTVNLTAGEHKIELVYIETGGPGQIDLDWSGPGFARSQMTFDGADDNLITNGTFNKVGAVNTGANWGVNGWTGQGEVWKDGFKPDGATAVSTSLGDTFVEIDGANGGLAQSVKTEAGKVYDLAFDVAGRPGAVATSKVAVVWNGAVIGTIAPTDADWHSYGFKVTGTGGNDQLAFRAVAGDTDGAGGLLDGVVLKPADGGNGVTPPGPAVNLLTGGNIESTAITAGGWGQPTALAGWTSSSGKFELFGDGLLGLRSKDGGDMAEIGTDTGTMSQSVKTEAGRAYGITFDLAGRPDGDGSKIDVLWNGAVIDSFTPAKGTMASYHTHAVGTGGNDVLAFRTAADSPEGLGGVLDNVELKASDHPVTPPPVDPPPAATNLLANGALESAVPAGDWGQPTTLAGWTSSSGKFEMWGDGLLGARSKDGGDMVEIGTDTGTMSQTVKTEAGRAYGITFDLAGRPDGDGSKLEVLWNGAVIDTITPTKGTMASYHTHAVGTGGNDVLSFRAAADSPEGLGGLLDNVELKVSDHALTTAEAASHDATGHTPIAFDLDGDGRIAVTGATSSQQKDPGAPLGRTVQFDIDGDGDIDTTEWLAGSGDGLLVDTAKIGPNGAIDGRALFGDGGGAYANGYGKLKLFDADGDGMVAGAELAKLGLWIDDGDAKLEVGEMKSAAEAGIASISTDMKTILDAKGAPLMQSSAFDIGGHEILTEDVWFATASHEPMPEQIVHDQHI